MANKLTTEKYKTQVPKNIKVCEEYTGDNVAINHKCVKCNNVWKARPSNIKHKSNPTGCPSCTHKGVRKDPLDFVQKLFDKHGESVKALEPYVDAKTKIMFRCDKGHKYTTYPRFVLKSSNRSCMQCYTKAKTEMYSHKGIFEDKLRVKFPKIRHVARDYINNKSVLQFKCNKGHVFESSVSDQMHQKKGGIGCPVCDKSLNQSVMALEFLNKLSKKSRLVIQHARNKGEYRIPETRFKVDGYNKSLNLAIEFHGSYYHGYLNKSGEKYIKTIRRDKAIKKKMNLLVVWEHDWIKDKASCVNNCLIFINNLKANK